MNDIRYHLTCACCRTAVVRRTFRQRADALPQTASELWSGRRAKAAKEPTSQCGEREARGRVAYAWIMAGMFLAVALTSGCRGPSRPLTPLEKAREEVAQSAIKTIPRPHGLLSYDFGTATPWPGFQNVPGAENVHLSANAVFGAYGRGDFPDALAGDWVQASQESQASRLSVTLSGLRRGSYRGAIMARNVTRDMVAGRRYQVRANGIVVVNRAVTPQSFFSSDGFFYGVQFDDVPGVDWWERYVKLVTEWHFFEFESTGRLTLDLDNCRLYALVVAPKTDLDEQEFKAFTAGTDASRKAWFLFDKFQFAPQRPRGTFRPSQEARERGYVTFSRPPGSEVTYNTLPSSRETAASPAAAGAPGQSVPVTFSVRTLRPVKDIRVTVGPLTRQGAQDDSGTEGEDGIFSDNISVEAVRYKLSRTSDAWEIFPEIIQKQQNIDLPADVTKRWWLTVSVPPDALPGKYTGTIFLESLNAPPAEIDLTVTVYPFKLAPADVSFGVWYNDPWISSYCTGLMGGVAARGESIEQLNAPLYPSVTDRAAEAYRLRMLDADLTFLSTRGFNSISTPAPNVTSIGRDGRVMLDFSVVEAYPELLEKYGMNTRHPGIVDLALLSQRTLGAAGSAAEFAPPHRQAYRSALLSLERWWGRRSADVLGLAADRPTMREGPATRSVEWVLNHLETIRETSGIKPTVTLCYDVYDKVSWRPILDLKSTVYIRPWPHAAPLIRHARDGEKQLRFFDGGWSRYSFGFFTWAAEAQGNWQRDFNTRQSAFNPIWESPSRPAVYPSPDGPLSTLRLESAARGITDLRYMTTLDQYIEQAIASEKPRALEAARAANRTIRDIRRRASEWPVDRRGNPAGPGEDQLDRWRRTVAEHIEKIHNAL